MDISRILRIGKQGSPASQPILPSRPKPLKAVRLLPQFSKSGRDGFRPRPKARLLHIRLDFCTSDCIFVDTSDCIFVDFETTLNNFGGRPRSPLVLEIKKGLCRRRRFAREDHHQPIHRRQQPFHTPANALILDLEIHGRVAAVSDIDPECRPIEYYG